MSEERELFINKQKYSPKDLESIREIFKTIFSVEYASYTNAENQSLYLELVVELCYEKAVMTFDVITKLENNIRIN